MQPLGEVVEADGLLVVGDGGEDAGGGVDGGIVGRGDAVGCLGLQSDPGRI